MFYKRKDPKITLIETNKLLSIDSSIKCSFEIFQNDEWKVVQDNFELTNQEELSLNGFLQLHLMEAEDNCGNILILSFF